jgi:hypothetical protein
MQPAEVIWQVFACMCELGGCPLLIWVLTAALPSSLAHIQARLSLEVSLDLFARPDADFMQMFTGRTLFLSCILELPVCLQSQQCITMLVSAIPLRRCTG